MSTKDFFAKNLDIVFFIYGLAFVVMGIAILVQPRKESEFKLARILWLLAGFGLVHGVNELLDMWAIIKGRNPTLDLIRWFHLVVSYFFLFEFGRRLFEIKKNKGWWIAPAIGFLVLISSLLSADFWKTGSIYARYFLGFPAATLTAFGLSSYYHYEKKALEGLKVKKYFFLTGASFFVYGILGGWVVPQANFFPANWLNTDSFLQVVKVPVQVFRALCAVSAAMAVIGVLKIFNQEVVRKLRKEIVKREQTEKALWKLSSAIEQTADSVIITDRNGIIEYVNHAFEELTGYAKEEAIGKTPAIVKSGLMDKKFYEQLWGTILSGKVFRAELANRKKSGELYYEIKTITPLKDGQGNILYFVSTGKDITERRQAEEKLKAAYDQLKQAQAQLVQSEKLATVGQLAAGVAHEINNPLFVIAGEAEMLLKKADQNEETKATSKTILRQTKRIKEITTRLLEFSKSKEFKQEPLKINRILEDAIQLLSYQTKMEGIDILKNLATDLPIIRGDENQLQEVFLNMMLNAVQAMEKGGKLQVKTFSEESPKGKIVVIEFEDTGKGIDETMLKKIFDPFVTTREKGVGLGLAICHRIIENHGGTIEAHSQLEKGSTFLVKLPIR